jgi:hypothetical protein
MREPHLPIVQGEFTRTGPLTADGTRQAVPLADGRVLLVGTAQQPNTGAEFGILEIYDPATGQVRRLDGTPVTRTWSPHGTVRLADGRILRTGGMEMINAEGQQRPAPAEIIDPAGGSITVVGPMAHQRSFNTATLLEDGRVLLTGGDVGDSGPTASAELFDPVTGTFREIDPLNHARLYHAATLLEDGRVLITGGYAGDVTTAEVFDPASGSFEVVGDLVHGRVDHSATLLADGRVLLAGGSAIDEDGLISDRALASAELFDPRTGQFAETGPLATERSQHTAVLLEDGRVLVAGGYNADGSPATTELFDPGTGTFVRGADALDRIGEATAARLPDGQVLVLGEGGPPELFDPSSVGPVAPKPTPRPDLAGRVTPIDGPAVERYAHTATHLADGRVLVVGGRSDRFEHFDSAELYDPATGRWSPTGPLQEARAWHVAALLHDGRVLVAGGSELLPDPDGSESFQPINSAEVYDPATGAFTRVGPMSVARATGFLGGGDLLPLTATVVGDGRVLIAMPGQERTIDLFDPQTNTFASLRSGCQGHPILLPDGRVLLGCDRGRVFDPLQGQVIALPDAEAVRRLGTTLADGRIVLSGGAGNLPLLFDPDEGPDGLPWVDVEALVRERFGGAFNVMSTTELPDRRILVLARGFDEEQQIPNGLATVFDPSLATFTEVAGPASRYAATATLLQDGRILIVGKPDRSPDRTDPEPPAAELLDLGLPR